MLKSSHQNVFMFYIEYNAGFPRSSTVMSHRYHLNSSRTFMDFPFFRISWVI